MSQQELMRRDAARCCASTRTRASACRAAPTSPARPAAAAARRRRRRRQLQPAQHAHPGAGHRAAAELLRPTAAGTRCRTIHGVADVDSNFEPTQPELRITVDRARAADLGVHIDSLASSLRTLVGGEEVSKFKDGDDQFSVLLRLDEQFRNNPQAMGDLLVPASGGRMVRRSATSRS